MATIRKDVVQIGFDIDFGEFSKLLGGMEDLKKTVSSGIGEDEFSDLGKEARKAADGVGGVKDAVKGVNSDGVDETAKGLKETASQAKKAHEKIKPIANETFNKTIAGLKKLGSTMGTVGVKAGKLLAGGIAAGAAGVGAIVTKSVQEYADYEQLVGGVETLFKESAGTVQKYAATAYKDSGLSANDYMETVTSFSASLIQSLGGDTESAAKLAQSAIVGMSDNANKMGTDMESIQNAYQGFAKQNYTMLDNLKLGYGGTQDEMERLIKDASKMTDVQEELGITVDGSSLSFSNIINAISVVQKKMGIAGTTAAEAEGTISGSLSMMKSAWTNTLTALVTGGDNFDECIDNLVYSAGKFGENIMPAILRSLDGVGMLIEKLAPTIEENLPTIIDSLLPPLIKAATALLAGVLKALPDIAKAFAKEIPGILQTVFDSLKDAFGIELPAVSKIVDFFKENTKAVAKFIPVLLGLVGVVKLMSSIKSAGSFLGGLFGESSKGGKGGGKKNSGLFKTFKELAKMKPNVVLKGMANLAIIFGGLTLLAAAFALVAPLIAGMSDLKSLVETFAIVSVLGVACIALAKPMAALGMIKVSKVALGLANIAIVLVGLTALAAAFAYVAPYIAQLSDTKSLIKVISIVGILGAVGTALTVFAGIAGMVPIGVVLTGLANIALALGGLTAIVTAFGALGQIPGFNDFISTGGDVLANLFGQLGKIVGSVIGSIGEALTASLPQIGDNLSAFAASIAPMMAIFSSTDVSGVGNFLTALGSFILLMSGEKLLSFITGGVNYAELGTQLTSFGENASGFFATVATYPENGFTNATALFNCLAGLKSLPKEGGVVGWFTGGINYETLANGLGQLSSEKVTGFFNTVSGLKQVGFDNATALFDCLAGLKALPKEGGVVGWFTGEVDYSKIATGLGQLSGESVKNFFNMVGKLKPIAFENAKLFFNSLASIGDLPKSGGWWDKLTGNETSALGNIATELGKFGEKTEPFFTQVNSLNVSKMNGLWDSLKKSESVTAKVSKIVDEHIKDMVDKISQLPVKMGEGLKASGDSLATALVKVWKDAVNASVPHVNKVLNAANWILKEFGSSKRVATWEPYAKGTNGHKGGNALVNDGNGAELVQMPNGYTFIPKGRNVLIPNAPKGMKVLSAEQTAYMMGRSTPTFRYADGTGGIDLWSYIDNASGLVNKITSGISYSGTSGFSDAVSRGFISTLKGPMGTWVGKLFSEAGALGLADYVASKGVKQWRSTVIRALKMEGLYSAANVKRTLYQMQTESGGNPRAINLWDSNAKKGTPSKGLMQVIDPTFRSYARAGYNKNIYDPLSNILASVRYAVSRYGSLAKAFRGKGYGNGGIATRPSIFGEDGAEMAIPLSRTKRNRGLSLWAKTGDMLGMSGYSPDGDGASTAVTHVENNNYSPQFHLTLNGTVDRTTERTVKRWIQESLEDAFESMERTSPRLTEV